MSEISRVDSLGVERPGQMFIFSYEEAPLEPGQFRVDTLHTGFSAGTELTFVKGSNPYLSARWDHESGFFIPGEATAHYPIPFLGYMEVGRVSRSLTRTVREGATVAMSYGHKTGHTANNTRDFFVVLPTDLDPLLGIYVAQMGPICANGLLHAAADLVGTDVRDLGDGVRGRNVLVTGAGVVGLLTALFCRSLDAADVVIADGSPFRRSVAEKMGFVTVDDREAAHISKERWIHGPDRGADLVLQCRASPASLHEGLRALRPQGTVIDLAFYQGGADSLRLGEEFHHNGLVIRCAQIGRVPRGLDFTWNRQRLARETLKLLRRDGASIRDHMITHIVHFRDAPRFVSELLERRGDFIQVVFKVRD
jgi:Zinc-binding dehydrogenase